MVEKKQLNTQTKRFEWQANTLPGYKSKENLGFCADVFDGWWTRSDLTSKYVIEHLRHIFFALEIDAI